LQLFIRCSIPQVDCVVTDNFQPLLMVIQVVASCAVGHVYCCIMTLLCGFARRRT